MGDYRFNVKISLMGKEDEPAVIDWWLNWSPDLADKLYCAVVEKAHEVGLEVDDRTYLFKEA